MNEHDTEYARNEKWNGYALCEMEWNGMAWFGLVWFEFWES